MLAMTAGILLIVRAGDGLAVGRWGFIAGILLGLAIATKAIAGFGIVGGLGAVALFDARESAALRWSLSDRLTHEGYRVVEAGTAREALLFRRYRAPNLDAQAAEE